MKHPLVSVGMPVYNGEKLIRRALDSILKQNYPLIEIIISENNSADTTYTICTEYKKRSKDIDIRILRQNTTIPVLDNFMAVLEPAKGKYFMWAAADDSWSSSFVSKLVEKLESNTRYAVAQTAIMKVSESNYKNIGYVNFKGKNNPEKCSMLQLTKRIVSPLKYNFYIYGLFRRELLIEAFRYAPRIPSSDRWFLLQFPLAGFKFGYIDEPLYIRTIADKPLYERYPEEELGEQNKHIKSKLFWFGAIPIVKKMLTESSLISDNQKKNIYIVLLQLFLAKAKSPNISSSLRLIATRLLPNTFIQYVRKKRRKYVNLKMEKFKEER